METIRELIQRLQQQSDRQAVPSELLATVHELETALRQAMTEPVRQVKSGNISVVLPSGNRLHNNNTQPRQAEQAQPVKSQEIPVATPPKQVQEVPDNEKRFAPRYTQAPVEPLPVVSSAPKTQVPEEVRPVLKEARPAEEEVKTAPEEVKSAPVKIEVPEFRKPDESRIIETPPTVAENFHLSFEKEDDAKKQPHVQQMEMNDIFSQTHSLNDRLKADQKEVGSTLHEEPVKDLRRAIGVNDRFVYLSELFRGDEVMYERSLKTINNFRIYPEAEYWIERELKVKLGWDENKETVKQFRSLVRRRFMV